MTYEDLFWISVQVICFSAILGAAACGMPERESQQMIDARWQERNVRVQLDIVPQFQEVWYKHHLYVIFSNPAARQGMLAHAGHCNGIHVTRIGGEQQ